MSSPKEPAPLDSLDSGSGLDALEALEGLDGLDDGGDLDALAGGGKRRSKPPQFHQLEMPPQRTFGGDKPGDGRLAVEAFVKHDRDAVAVQFSKLAIVCRA